MKNNYANYKYIVNNREGFDLTTALRLWKTKYADDYRDFQKDVIIHDGLKDFDKFVQECWNDIEPFTVEDALKVENTEDRRTYFDCIGVENLFRQLNPILLDKQVIKKKRTRWDADDKEYTHNFEDVYELYQIDGKKLFDKDRWGREPENVYAVRCWCTTTNREYWLYVTREAAEGRRWWGEDSKPDAIRAISWTIRIDVPIEDVEKIYRQGDIIVVKVRDGVSISNNHPSYHLSKEDYLTKMYSES